MRQKTEGIRMSLITKAAYLTLLFNGTGGCITFRDGQRSIPFFSQEIGLALSRNAVTCGLVDSVEILELERQIRESGLPTTMQPEDYVVAEINKHDIDVDEIEDMATFENDKAKPDAKKRPLLH